MYSDPIPSLGFRFKMHRLGPL